MLSSSLKILYAGLLAAGFSWQAAAAFAPAGRSIPFTTTTLRRSYFYKPAQNQQILVRKGSQVDTDSPASVNSGVGTYRPFAEHAWSKLLQETDWFLPDASLPTELSSNVAPAKGFPEGSVVKMETRALRPAKPSLVRYARYALLETLIPPPELEVGHSSEASYNSTVGIQVLNLVIFPSEATNLPVFGADLVSLPGDKHLILLDAQPMEGKRCHQDHWEGWYQEYVTGKDPSKPNFAWGGDIPEQVAKYVSEYALWTRLGAAATGDEDGSTTPTSPTAQIQTDVWDAFQEHLDLYLKLLSRYEKEQLLVGDAKVEQNEQEPYIQYRLNNDPAKPMLKSLYGEEFTQRVLEEVLFPELKQH